MLSRILLFASLCAPFLPLAAQDQCPLPPSPFSGERNIFSPQQEMYLGEAMAEQAERNWRVVDDEELTARLQSAGDRLLKHLPQTDLKYRFILIDLPEIDSFGIPGGRIYVTRKMVAFLKNDDELAALLSHEIGHTYTHQQAIDFTRILHETLGVDSVGDRESVRRVFNDLIDNRRRKPGRYNSSHLSQEQIVADRLGLYAMARAGYPPEAMAPFFDRLAETHGKTGSFLSDLFGATTEDSRRLRDLLKNTAGMPKSCVDPAAIEQKSSFQGWQQAVIAYSGTGEKTVDLADALVRKSVLDPPLQDDFRRIRFSPDGKHLLVQDESGITVLTREPLAPLFRIRAADARLANFSPDSASIVFYTNGLRVERWSVAEKKQSSAHEILERRHCLQSELSPDGNTFVCFDEETTLRAYDVNSGSVIYEKKNFALINWFAAYLALMLHRDLESLHFINLAFTPDARVMIAASDVNVLALDLSTRKAIGIAGSLKPHLLSSFTFLAPDRIAVAEASAPGVYGFPSGKLISKVKLGGRSLEPASHGDLLLIRPLQKAAVGIFDLKQEKMLIATGKEAIDAYDDVVASEGKDGKLLLTREEGKESKVFASVDLPRAELTRLRAVEVSADMNWLALSLRDRGAIYDLSSSQRSMFLRGFRGAQFVSGPALLADYPKNGDTPRTIATLDLKKHSAFSNRTLSDDLDALQIGAFLVVRKPQKTGGSLYKDVTVEVQDVASGQVVFSQRFPNLVPSVFIDPRAGLLIFASGVSAKSANSSATDQVQAQVSWPDAKKSVYEIQIVDLISGKKIRDIHIDSGKFSFAIRDIGATRDFLTVADSENRVQLYSMATGQQIGIVFGGPAYLSSGNTMSVVTQKGKIALYECAALKKLKEYDFPSAAIYSQLSNDGHRLVVLTADQTAYLLRTQLEPKVTAQAPVN